jgi:arabinofuranosyltransferase
MAPAPLLTNIDESDDPMLAFHEYGIADERGAYFLSSSLLHAAHDGVEPHHLWSYQGLALKASGAKVAVAASVGYLGYFAGPHVHIVDGFVLADPLLARLPTTDSEKWRIGHFVRRIPPYYIQSLEANENLFRSQSLALVYDKLNLVTRGPLWSMDRFTAIWKLNTGQYDALLSNYRP